jgi:branched-chain amino acid transport system ATP-binding protein
MLSIGRARRADPRLLILHEAIEGLAPLVRADAVKAGGPSILLIAQNVDALISIADRTS